MKIAILIINRNDYHNTEECLNSLKDMNIDNKIKQDILLIDNNSQDGSQEKLCSMFSLETIHPEVWSCEQESIFLEDKAFGNNRSGNVCIKLDNNYGFTGANNFGFRYALQNGYSHCLMLNNDTIVPKNFLSNLIESANTYPNDVISCVMTYAYDQDTIRSTAYHLDCWGTQRHTHQRQKLSEIKFKERHYIGEMGSGCCLFIPKGVLEIVGGQDHNYFFNIDDSDFTYNMHKQGIKIVIDTSINLIHKVSMSMKGKNDLAAYYYYRNLMYFRNKWFKASENILFHSYWGFKFIKSLLIGLITGKRRARTYYHIVSDLRNGKLGKYNHK